MKNMGIETVGNIMGEMDASEMDGKYLTFWTDKQLFGIPISHVVQIVGMQKITQIPEFPDYTKGIINLRGAIIPVIDIRLRLHKPETEYNERTCIIVTDINNINVGFIVDEVDAVTVIADDQISPPPKMSSGTDGFINGVGKLESKVVLLMDASKIVSDEQLNVLSTVSI
ncbi:MAG: chemotaxis protein CheW [Oscillospiraceae bacterium]